jgi:uncharacterized phiE125 gp8 family phage protein
VPPRIEWTRTVEPVLDPVTVADAKLHCRALADVNDEDGNIRTYLRAAVRIGERQTGRGWTTQTWKLGAEDWAAKFYLPMAAPLQSVTSVKYYAADGTLTTLSSSYYLVDTLSEPGCVALAPNYAWPSLQADRRTWPIEITYVVGWTSVAQVPDDYKIGVCLLADHLYENRSAVQVGVGIGAVELPLGLSTFFGDAVHWRPPVCA